MQGLPVWVVPRMRGMVRSKLDFSTPIFGRDWRIRTVAKLDSKNDIGECDQHTGNIRILSSCRGRRFFGTLLHELTHASNDPLSEEWVREFEDVVTEIFYRPDVLARCGLQRITPENA